MRLNADISWDRYALIAEIIERFTGELPTRENGLTEDDLLLQRSSGSIATIAIRCIPMARTRRCRTGSGRRGRFWWSRDELRLQFCWIRNPSWPAIGNFGGGERVPGRNTVRSSTSLVADFGRFNAKDLELDPPRLSVGCGATRDGFDQSSSRGEASFQQGPDRKSDRRVGEEGILDPTRGRLGQLEWLAGRHLLAAPRSPHVVRARSTEPALP